MLSLHAILKPQPNLILSLFFAANLNFLMNLQPTGSCLPLGCTAAGVKTGGSRVCSLHLCPHWSPSVLNDAANPPTPLASLPLPTHSHGCGLPCLTMVVASRPAGSSMGICQKMISSLTPWSHLRRLEGSLFHPMATPCGRCSTCEDTISESLTGLVPWLSAFSLEFLASRLHPFTSTWF